MGEIILPIQSAKISGTGALASSFAAIDGGGFPWKLLFDASQTESALWQFKLPSDYSSNPVLKLFFAMASGTTGSVDLECDLMAVSNGDANDIDVESFDSVNEIAGGASVQATAGLISSCFLTLSNNDGMVADDVIILRINRDHDDADDTAIGDLELLTASLAYTSS